MSPLEIDPKLEPEEKPPILYVLKHALSYSEHIGSPNSEFCSINFC